MNLTQTRTPDTLTPALLAACRTLVPDGVPVRVPCRPEPGARVAQAWTNTTDRPGRLTGWRIVQWEEILIECTPHAVLDDGNGPVCITPGRTAQDTILFLPDPVLATAAAAPPACQVALVERPDVARFIRTARAMRDLLLRQDTRDGKLRLSPEDSAELAALNRDKESLALRLNVALKKPASPCLCGSRKRFSACCRPKLAKLA